MKRILSIILSVLCCFFVVGCAPTTTTPPASENSQDIFVSVSEVTLEKGETYEIEYYLFDDETQVTFESQNTAVCTVDGNGKVVAVGVGETNVIIKAGETVRIRKFVVTTSATYRVKIYDGDVVLLKNGTFTLNAALVKGIVEYPDTCTYTIDKTDVATVDASGTIHALQVGNCTVTVSCEKEGRTYFAKANVTVSPEVYIDCVDEVSFLYMEQKRVPYTIKNIADDTVVQDAVAEVVLMNEGLFNVSGNLFTGIDVGETTLKLMYAGIVKTVSVRCYVDVKENEFNFFAHSSVIKDAFAMNKFDYLQHPDRRADGNYYSTLRLTNTVAGQDMGMNCLEISSRANGGFHLDYLTLFIESRKTFEEMIVLESKGYTCIEIEFYILNEPARDLDGDGHIEDRTEQDGYDADGDGWVEDGSELPASRHWMESVYLAQGANYNVGVWNTVRIPLERYLDLYEEKHITHGTLFFGVGDAHSPDYNYTMFIKPIKFAKTAL